MNRLHIIHDNRMAERYEPLMQELKTQGITDYEIWSPVECAESVVKSINLSHKQLVKWAKAHDWEYVIIAEDDLQFTHPTSWKYFLENMPKGVDIYSSGTYYDDLNDKNLLTGFHLYVVFARFFQDFLNVSDDQHIDTAICNLKGYYKVCRPFAAIQRPCWSANARQEVNYNLLLNEGDLYRG